MVIFKELREVKADLKLQQIENGRKQDRILELSKENRELKEQVEKLKKELTEVLNDRKYTTTKQTSSRKTSK